MSDPKYTCTITRKPCDGEALLCSCVGCTAYCETLAPITPESVEAALKKGREARERVERAGGFIRIRR